MTVWLLPLTAILPQTSWDLLILPLYTHNLPLAGGIEPPTKGPHSPPPQAAGQPERFSRGTTCFIGLPRCFLVVQTRFGSWARSPRLRSVCRRTLASYP